MDTGWFLEGVETDGSHVEHEMVQWPFRLGRDEGNDLVVAVFGLSRKHAEFHFGSDRRLRVTDLGSTNGTYVNHERVRGTRVVGDGDVLHFATAEFCLRRHVKDAAPVRRDKAPEGTVLVARSQQPLSSIFIPYERPFNELLAGQGLAAVVQPIVHADGGGRFAFELLGRCSHPELPPSPLRLFEVAALLRREADLSRAFRQFGVRAVAARPGPTLLFVNTHPKETFAPELIDELVALRRQVGPVEVVLEIHETAIFEVARMRELAAQLRDMDIRFAYDDFGAGQARLNELGEVPAHFVKFDMGLIRGLDEASDNKRKLVAELVHLVHELGSQALAEGVETPGEAQVCRAMGFELIQGYLTGKPGPIESI